MRDVDGHMTGEVAPPSGKSGPENTAATSPNKPSATQPSQKTSKRRRRRRKNKAGANANPNANAALAEQASDQSNPNTADQPEKAQATNRHDKGGNGPRRRRRRGGAKRVGDEECAPQSNKAVEAGNSQHRRRANRRPAFQPGYENVSYRERPAYAALDLGTNNCRLLVAVPNGTTFRVVDAFSRIVRLGEGIAHTGRLSDDAMDRAVEALQVCATKLEDRGIKRLRLIATEACRIAENGEIFLNRVRDETGLELEIVNRETEARLAVAGCSSLVDRAEDGAILFDIGGGSSELVWLDFKNPRNRRKRPSSCIRSWTSLPVGVVNISERHGGVEVTEESFEGMVNEVMGLLDDFPQAQALSEMVTNGKVHMLGTSGTVTTLAGVHLGLDFYERRRVDGLWMSAEDVTAMTAKLLAMTFDQRVENACIGAERADLVLAGCAILEALRRKWPCARLRVADRGLREGILYELMGEDGVLRTSRSDHSGGRHRGQNHNKNRRRRGGRHQNGRGPNGSESGSAPKQGDA